MTADRAKQPHDGLIRTALTSAENARTGLAAVLPADLVAHLDLSRLRRLPARTLDKGLTARETDALWEVPFAHLERSLVVHVIAEAQSREPGRGLRARVAPRRDRAPRLDTSSRYNARVPPKSCSACGASWSVYDRVCECGALVHAEQVAELRTRARIGRMAKDPEMTIGALHRAAQLVPEDHPEHAALLAELSALQTSLSPPAPGETSARPKDDNADELSTGPDAYDRHKESKLPKWLAPLGVFGLLLWKFKGVLLLILSKGKLLLMGFTKWKTLLSMLLAFGAYWTIWGWKFAAGFVLSIYVHEMGHVWALRRAGLAASAPMFIPFVGAFVRLKEAPRSPIEDARIGLGGPWWGLGAALACLGVYHLTGSAIWAALVHVGAFINLFNLIPVWQLDGGRSFAPLSRPERIALLVLVLAGFALVRDGLLLFIAAGAAYRVWKNDGPPEGDLRGTLAFAFVFTVLTLLILVPVPGVEAGARVPVVAPVGLGHDAVRVALEEVDRHADVFEPEAPVPTGSAMSASAGPRARRWGLRRVQCHPPPRRPPPGRAARARTLG